MLAGHLRQKGVDVVTTQEPGGTPLGRHLRQAFLETEEVVAPRAELLLFAADRAQHVELLIKPALEQGRIVISDRYADATFAYQGAGRGFDEEMVRNVIRIATGGLQPDRTLFFDISVETAIRRMSEHQGEGRVQNRMDLEAAEFYDRVRTSYLGLAEREANRFKVVPAEGPVDEIHKAVVGMIDEFLDNASEADI